MIDIEKAKFQKMHSDPEKLILAERLAKLHAYLTNEGVSYEEVLRSEKAYLAGEALKEMGREDFDKYWRPSVPYSKKFVATLPTLNKSTQLDLLRKIRELSRAGESFYTAFTMLKWDKYHEFYAYTLITVNDTTWLRRIANLLETQFGVVCCMCPYVEMPMHSFDRPRAYFKLKVCFKREGKE